jgi:hypothetical protein
MKACTFSPFDASLIYLCPARSIPYKIKKRKTDLVKIVFLLSFDLRDYPLN